MKVSTSKAGRAARPTAAQISDRRFTDSWCATCDSQESGGSPFRTGPSHDGSEFCESGSIASGGQRAHCRCDECYSR
jgi:hypothetical protein